MPLRAQLDGNSINAALLTETQWEALKGSRSLRMPCCHALAYRRTSRLGTRHFAHSPGSHCGAEGESAEHLAGNFAKEQLQQGDDMIRNADHLMAEAIRVVAGLYKDGVLEKPKNYSYAFPNLLTFHDAPTVVEQKLFVMYLEHRMRTFQDTFHASPDDAMWYGWSEMQRDLTEIRELAAEMRRNHITATGKSGE